MDLEFWRERWAANQIGFHEGKPNTLLTKHFAALGLAPGARVFLPLCGKTRDIHWLLAQGFQVVGAELSALAVAQLFDELGVVPEITSAGELKRYGAPGIVVFQGDIFALDAETLGPADAVYDRAALVALPKDMRARYAAHVTAIAKAAPQLVITFVYDQSVMAGPPHSVDDDEVRALYGSAYDLDMRETASVPGGLKGMTPADEHVWRLSRR